MEVDVERQPNEGEVYVITTGGAFVVRGSVPDVSQKLMMEDWCHLELAESGDQVIVRSSQVVALRGGSKPKRGTMGFHHRE